MADIAHEFGFHLFDQFARRDIGICAGNAQRVPVRIAFDGLGAAQYPQPFVVGRSYSVLNGVEMFCATQHRPQFALHARHVVRAGGTSLGCEHRRAGKFYGGAGRTGVGVGYVFSRARWEKPVRR